MTYFGSFLTSKYFFCWVRGTTLLDILWFAPFLDFIFSPLRIFQEKKCDPNNFFDENKISHMRLEMITEGKTFSKIDLFAFLTICLWRCSLSLNPLFWRNKHNLVQPLTHFNLLNANTGLSNYCSENDICTSI